MYLAKEVDEVDFVDEVDTHEAHPAGEKRTRHMRRLPACLRWFQRSNCFF
jgi:hypothetical protein